MPQRPGYQISEDTSAWNDMGEVEQSAADVKHCKRCNQ